MKTKKKSKTPNSKKSQIQFDEHKVMRSLCRKSFEHFVKVFWHTIIPAELEWNWHMTLLCEEMQKIAERVAKGLPNNYDLIINISPGTSKSTICSIMFPAWVWTFFPSARFVCNSYSERLAYDLSFKSRSVIKSDLYKKVFPEIKLNTSQDTKGYFVNNHMGDRFAVGTDGTVTGMHGHFILIDDPLNPEAASSDQEISNTNRFLKDTLFSRQTNKRTTTIICIMQRLHQDDPTAMMLEQLPNVRHLKIPASLDWPVQPPELEKFYKDGLMDPNRLPQNFLDKVKAGDRGDYVLAGQYGQDPTPTGGAMFKIERLHEDERPPVRFLRMVRYWDKAATEAGGAYTVGLKMGLDFEDRIWILDVVRVRFDSAKRERLILKTAKEDGRNVLVGVEQEPGSGGKESAERTAKNLSKLLVKVKINLARGDKVARADPFSTAVNSGSVYLVPGASWIPALKSEFKYFPYSKYKDHVDAASGAYTTIWTGRRVIGGLSNKKKPEAVREVETSRQRMMQYVNHSLNIHRQNMAMGLN